MSWFYSIFGGAMWVGIEHDTSALRTLDTAYWSTCTSPRILWENLTDPPGKSVRKLSFYTCKLNVVNFRDAYFLGGIFDSDYRHVVSCKNFTLYHPIIRVKLLGVELQKEKLLNLFTCKSLNI